VTRRRIIAQTLIPVLLVWAILIPVAVLLNADWPDHRLAKIDGSGKIGWQILILAALVISVFLMKARVAVWNRRERDWLALSFCYLDLAIVLFFMLVAFSPLWLDLRAQYAEEYRWVYQGLVFNILIAVIIFYYFFTDAIVQGRFERTRVEDCDALLEACEHCGRRVACSPDLVDAPQPI
jgi:hypothetical protein